MLSQLVLCILDLISPVWVRGNLGLFPSPWRVSFTMILLSSVNVYLVLAVWQNILAPLKSQVAESR